MALSLTSKQITGGQFGTFPAGVATDGTNIYPAIAAMTAAGVILDTSLLALDGTDATGITPLAGAVGIRGWLSTIHNDAISAVPAAVTTSAPVYTTGTTAAASLTTGGALRVDATGTLAYPQGSGSATVTLTVASPNPGVVNWNLHGLVPNTPVVFATSGALPTGLTAGTTYFVIPAGLTLNSFEVALTVGGAAIVFSGAQSGVQTATASQPGPLMQMAVKTGAPNLVSGNIYPIQSDTAGQVRVGNGSWAVAATSITNASGSHATGVVLGTSNNAQGTGKQPLQFIKNGDQGEINQIIVTSNNVTTGALKAYIFNVFPSNTTNGYTDNVAPSIAAADLVFLTAVVPLGAADSGLGTMTMWTSGEIHVPTSNTAGGQFYVLLVVGATAVTPAANGINVVCCGRY